MRRLSQLSATALVALAFALFGGAAIAGAASNELKLDPASGTALPTTGGKFELNLVCDGNGKQDCQGRVEVLARGGGDEGDSVLGPDSVKVKVDDADDRLFTLSDEARDYLRDVGPLRVTVVIRQPDGSTSSRELVIAEMKPVSIGAPTIDRPKGASASAVGENTLTYTWSKKLKWGTMAVMGDFRCPASHPFVAQGGGAASYGYAGDVKLTASAGVGYAAFDDPVAKPYWNADHFGGSRMWTMTGWYKGDLFRNNIWAPAFEEGSFKLSITCTNRPISSNYDDSPAYMYQEPRKGLYGNVSTFLPWVRG